MRNTSDLILSSSSLPRGRAPLPPQPPGVPVLGHLIDVARDPLRLFLSAAVEIGDVVGLRVGPWRGALVSAPEHVKHVLVTRVRNYPKSPTYRALKLVLGNGLVTSEGELWQRQRRLAQPAFHRQRLAGFVDTFARCTGDLLTAWDGEPDHAEVDIHREMQALTLRAVGLTLFSTELGGEASAVGTALARVLVKANALSESILPMPGWLPTPANFRFRRSLRVLDELVYRLIGERRAGEELPDLLGMLVSATDETGTERMDDRQLRDEVMTLLLAGHETTANALTWAFYLLSTHPEVYRRLHEEARGLGGRMPTLGDLGALPYTGQVLDEAMRLYPPAWILERQAVEDDEIGGYRIPAGSFVVVSPWTVHRNPRLWDNPEGFDPDRFAPAACEARPRHAYLPFGAGPRQCIGNNFALMEAKVMLAGIAARYRPEIVPGQRIALEAGITLRPKHGIRVRLHRMSA